MRRLVIAAVAVALLAVGIVAAYVVQTRHAARDVQGSPTVEFDTTTDATPPPTSAPQAGGAVEWATFGYDDQRTRYDPTVALRPPFRKIWTFHGRTLLEFPPAVAFGRLYLPTFDGRFYALDQRTGAELWMHATGRCGWGTPAIWRRTVIVTFIGRKATCDEQVPGSDGIVVSYDADTGRVRWRRTSARPSRRRSSCAGSCSSGTGTTPCGRSTPGRARPAGASAPTGR